MTWGIKHVAIATLYKGTILPLLSYRAPIWIEAMNYEHNRQKYIRVQLLINISLAKAHRTTSNDALCLLTGTTAIIIKLEEVAQRYKAKERTGICQIELDHEVEFKKTGCTGRRSDNRRSRKLEEAIVCAYTDGNKQDQGVGSGVAIFKGSDLVAKVQLKLDKRCSNNQAEQFVIVKAL
jgi:hypothetical protein